MDYEKAYKDALERARQSIEDCGSNNGRIKMIQGIFPELRESEDERIRKELMAVLDDLILPDDQKARFNTWLEKQKEASKAIEAVERIDKYIDQHLANAHDMKDSNPDKKYYRGWDDALGKMAGILQDVYSGEKQKESLRDFIDNFPYSDEQKEQKSVEIHIDNPNIQKVDPDIKITTSDSSADGKELLYVSNKSYKIGYRDGVASVKPAEWSEEDERKRLACIETINGVIDDELERWEDYNPGKPYSPIMKYDEQIDWLKSLRSRPKSSDNWKPSEEQMRCLESLPELLRNFKLDTTAQMIEEIHDKLKKL